jgi:hypothetical protein
MAIETDPLTPEVLCFLWVYQRESVDQRYQW